MDDPILELDKLTGFPKKLVALIGAVSEEDILRNQPTGEVLGEEEVIGVLPRNLRPLFTVAAELRGILCPSLESFTVGEAEPNEPSEFEAAKYELSQGIQKHFAPQAAGAIRMVIRKDWQVAISGRI